MRTNALPQCGARDYPTGCCPRFDPAGWEGQDLNLADKPFIVARAKSVAHVPLDMGKVFRDTIAVARDVPGYPSCA